MNPGAESGPATGLYIPAWSTNGPSVAPYGGSGFISATAPGPPDRGVNLFYGNGGNIYQDIDVSAAASMIDGGQVKYQISAWLGALGDNPSAALSYIFFDWSGNQLAPTAQLTGTSNATALSLASNFAALPAGTRRVHISVAFTFTAGSSLADNISFVIGAQAAPFNYV